LLRRPPSTRLASDPVHPRAVRASHLVHRITVIIKCSRLRTIASHTCWNKKEWHPERCGRPGRAWNAWERGMGGDDLHERGWPLRVACWDPLVCLVRVARTNGCWRCLSRREASHVNWRVTDSLRRFVPSAHYCEASDSRFEVHCSTVAAATCDHMKQPTQIFCVGCCMWRTIWRLVALRFALRPIKSRYIWRSVTRSATENGPQASSRRRVHGVHRGVLANRNAQLQSHANHADHIRPSRTDLMLWHRKEIRAKCANSSLLGRTRSRVRQFFLISRT